MTRASVIICAGFVAACAAAATSAQPKTGKQDTRQKPATTSLAVAWQKELDIEGAQLTALAAGPDAIVVASSMSGLSAFAPSDGRLLWRNEKVTEIQPVVLGSSVVIWSGTSLEALNQSTGAALWTAEAPGKSVVALSATDTLILAVASTTVMAWHPDGRPAWQLDLPAETDTPLVASADALYVGLTSSQLASIDAGTGTIRWTAKLPARLSGMSIAADRLFASGRDGSLYAFRIERGLEKSWSWRYRALGGLGNPAIGDRLVYFALTDNSLKAFDRGGGSLKWTVPLASRPVSGPALSGDNVVVPLANGQLLQASATTGKVPADKEKPADETPSRMGSVAAVQGKLFALVTSSRATTTLIAWGPAR